MGADRSSLPVHPGAVLKRRLQELKLPTAQIARMLGMSRQSLHDILACKQSITATVALRLAKLTATKPETWLDLQQARDLAAARSKCGEMLDQVPVLDERW